MIINPVNPLKEDFPIPDLKLLQKLANDTEEEAHDISRILDIKFEKDHYNYIAGFLSYSLRSITNRTTCVARLNEYYLHEIMILLRNVIEIYVDTFWVYSIYEESKSDGYKLAERFFKISYKWYDTKIEELIQSVQSNIFFRNIDIDNIKKTISKPRKKAIYKDNFETYDPHEKRNEIIKLQKTDWRALPGKITKKKQLEFKKRALKAADVATRIANNKNAEFIKNWEFLNKHVHTWSISFLKMYDEEFIDAAYRNYLNAFLGYTHDLLNLCFSYRGIEPNKNIRRIREQFIWF